MYVKHGLEGKRDRQNSNEKIPNRIYGQEVKNQRYEIRSSEEMYNAFGEPIITGEFRAKRLRPRTRFERAKEDLK